MGLDLQKAGLWTRFAAWLFDAILVCVIAVGIAFLHEQITLMRIFALVLILAGVIIPNCTAKDFNKKHIFQVL